MICKNDIEEEEKKGMTTSSAKVSFEKSAFSFDEVMSSRTLKPDVDWYIMQQLMPPIARLI